MQFLTNGVAFGDAVAVAGGSATSAALPATLPAGNYAVTATYSGDTAFTAGNGTLAGGESIYLPPNPGIGPDPATGTNLILQWPGTAGWTYNIQYTPSLNPATWSNLPAGTGLTGQAGTMAATNGVAGAGVMFYRIQMSH